VSDVLVAMTRTWGELDQLEKRNGLSFLREPDPGFVWAAYRWVRGTKLEDVLDSVPSLTPGDFVRSMKQLIDLLDQIVGAASQDARAARHREPPPSTGEQPAGEQPAGEQPAGEQPAEEVAPRNRSVAETARAAIDAMRRGVIAYTTLTD
jgi:ATP-dependent RNA helicase HelY